MRPEDEIRKLQKRVRYLEMQLEDCKLDACGVRNYIIEADKAKARIQELETELEKARTTAQYWKDSHLAGNERIRELESGICHQVLAFVREATEGRVSALAESFPVVRAVADLWHEKRCLEMRLEDCRLDAEGVAVYIHEATNAENRADRLAVVADALAEECEGLLLSCADDLEAANYWCDLADRTMAALRELYRAVEAARPYEDGEAVDVPDEAWERIDAALKAAEDL